MRHRGATSALTRYGADLRHAALHLVGLPDGPDERRAGDLLLCAAIVAAVAITVFAIHTAAYWQRAKLDRMTLAVGHVGRGSHAMAQLGTSGS
jgi:hypothetical protein